MKKIESITLKYPDEASEDANKELQKAWDKFGVTSGDVLTVNQSGLKGIDDKYHLITKIEKSHNGEALIVQTDLQDTNLLPVVLVIGNSEYRFNK